MKHSRTLVTLLLLALHQPSLAQTVTLPLQLDYGVIKKILIRQIYTGTDDAANIWHDAHRCSYLTLSNPHLAGHDGQIQLTHDVAAQIGTFIAGQCLPLFQWTGLFETWQRPTLSPDHTVVSLPVTQAMAYDRQGKPLDIAKLQTLIKTVAEPKLTGLKIDLSQYRPELEQTLNRYIKKDAAEQLKIMLDSLRFNKVNADRHGVAVELAFTPPANKPPLKTIPPLTATEQKQWQGLWQNWRKGMEKTIAHIRQSSSSDALKHQLTGILQDLERALNAGIAGQADRDADPVRTFFTHTWEKLPPLLRELAQQHPEVNALQYFTLIGATDTVHQLDTISAPFGLGISSDGLRHLARRLIAEQEQAETGKKLPP